MRTPLIIQGWFADDHVGPQQQITVVTETLVNTSTSTQTKAAATASTMTNSATSPQSVVAATTEAMVNTATSTQTVAEIRTAEAIAHTATSTQVVVASVSESALARGPPDTLAVHTLAEQVAIAEALVNSGVSVQTISEDVGGPTGVEETLTNTATSSQTLAESIAEIVVDKVTVTNLITSSGFETNVNGWSEGNCTVARVTNRAYHGSASLRVTVTSSSTHFTRPSVFPLSGATAGRVFTASYWIFGEGDAIGKTHRITLREENPQGLHDANTIFTVQAGWQRVSVTKTLVNNDSDSLFVFSIGPDANRIPNGAIYWIDAVQLEESPTASPYYVDNPSSTRNTQTFIRGQESTQSIVEAIVVDDVLVNSATSTQSLAEESTSLEVLDDSAQSVHSIAEEVVLVEPALTSIATNLQSLVEASQTHDELVSSQASTQTLTESIEVDEELAVSATSIQSLIDFAAIFEVIDAPGYDLVYEGVTSYA